MGDDGLTEGFIIVLIVIISLLFGMLITMQQITVSGKVVSIQPDTQITYNKILILDSNGHTFSQDISCTGNFQFQVNQTVSVIDYRDFGFDESETLNGFPSGCVLLK